LFETQEITLYISAFAHSIAPLSTKVSIFCSQVFQQSSLSLGSSKSFNNDYLIIAQQVSFDPYISDSNASLSHYSQLILTHFSRFPIADEIILETF